MLRMSVQSPSVQKLNKTFWPHISGKPNRNRFSLHLGIWAFDMVSSIWTSSVWKLLANSIFSPVYALNLISSPFNCDFNSSANNVNITLWLTTGGFASWPPSTNRKKASLSGEGEKRDWEEKGILKTVSSGSLTSCEQSEDPPIVHCPAL